jgi:hypothetical protein
VRSGNSGRHYLEGIDASGNMICKQVREHFNAVAFQLNQICKFHLLKKRLTARELIFTCFSLNFWKIQFRSEDFSFLHSIKVLDLFQFFEDGSNFIQYKICDMQIGLILNAFLTNNDQDAFLSPKSFHLSELKSKSSRLGSRKSSLFKMPENALHDYQLQSIDLCFQALSSSKLNNCESLRFRALSVLLISCSYETSSKELQHFGHFSPVADWIAKNESFFRLLLDSIFEILHPNNFNCKSKSFSPRIIRRLVLITSLVLKYADPVQVASNFLPFYVGGSTEHKMESFVRLLISSLGYYSIGRFCDSNFDIISGIRSLNIKMLHQILRTLSSLHLWRSVIENVISQYLENLPNVLSNLINIEGEIQKSYKYDSSSITFLGLGSIISLQSDPGYIDIGTKVQFVAKGIQFKIQKGVVVDIFGEEATVLLCDDGDIFQNIELEHLRTDLDSDCSGAITISDNALFSVLNMASMFPKRTRDRKVFYIAESFLIFLVEQ